MWRFGETAGAGVGLTLVVWLLWCKPRLWSRAWFREEVKPGDKSSECRRWFLFLAPCAVCPLGVGSGSIPCPAEACCGVQQAGSCSSMFSPLWLCGGRRALCWAETGSLSVEQTPCPSNGSAWCFALFGELRYSRRSCHREIPWSFLQMCWACRSRNLFCLET